RDLHIEDSTVRQILLGFEMDGLLVQHTLTAVQMLNKLRDAAAVMEFMLLDRIDPLIGELDRQPLVQECQLAQPLRERVEVEHSGVHDGRVRLEGDLCTGFPPGLSGLLQRRFRYTAGILLLPGESLTPDLEIEALRESVHTAHTHAM